MIDSLVNLVHCLGLEPLCQPEFVLANQIVE